MLLARGYEVIETEDITLLALISHRLRIPPDTPLDAARDEVRALPTGATADFNHFYRPDQTAGPDCNAPHCPGFQLVAWTADPQAQMCGAGVRIGLIDTGINADHEAFEQARLTVISAPPDGGEPSGRQHGTAVASILIGDPDGRSPGLVPEATLVAIDAFHAVGNDQRSDVFNLVGSMELLAAENVDVMNLSLSGPPNVVLERMITRLAELDIVVVAAAGNDGPQADPAYPGGYGAVLSVTAVDRNGAVYRRAGQGPHVDLAAPGVEVWSAASISGARGQTGTSFAAPFVTAAVAMALSRNRDMTVNEVAQALTEGARDLGDPGRDAVFGAGLVQLGPLCEIQAESADFVE